MKTYTTNKAGHCICGEKLSECREECCDATLRVLEGRWVRRYWCYYREEYHGFEVCDVFNGWYEVGRLVSAGRLWQMMVAVGGVTSFGRSWVAGSGIVQPIHGDTPEDAVIKAYAAMVDRKDELKYRYSITIETL